MAVRVFNEGEMMNTIEIKSIGWGGIEFINMRTGRKVNRSVSRFKALVDGESVTIRIEEGFSNGGHGMGQMPYSKITVDGYEVMGVVVDAEMKDYDPVGYIKLMEAK